MNIDQQHSHFKSILDHFLAMEEQGQMLISRILISNTSQTTYILVSMRE